LIQLPLIFLLLVINLSGQIFIYKLYKKKKLTVLIFHLSFIIIIAGAAITRYTGYEGRVHIREGHTVSYGLTSEKFMSLNIYNSADELLVNHSDKVMVTNTSLGSFYREGEIDNIPFSVRYSRYIPNASESVVDSEEGEPIIQLLITRGRMFREVVYLKEGESRDFDNLSMGFNADEICDLNIMLKTDTFNISASIPNGKKKLDT